MLSGFKRFMMRGNVVDLAVAVVVGAAFGAVVTALVKDLVTPFIAAIMGKPDFSAIVFEINGSRFLIGDFINTLLSFIVISGVIYFLVVVPVNALSARMRPEQTPAVPATRKCPECLSDIQIGARRCPHCTSVLTETPPDAQAPKHKTVSP